MKVRKSLRIHPAVLLGLGCLHATTPEVLASAALAPLSGPPSQVQVAEIARADFVARLQEALASPERDSAENLLATLEHLMPAWQSEQRQNRAEPLENLLSLRVVTHFEIVLEAFRSGSRDRRLVAAWALGFSRVPDNDIGLVSPHPLAVSALVEALATADDGLLRNVLLGLWKIGDSGTPLRPILDLMVSHHDADVRADAALALSTVLQPDTAARVIDSTLVALADKEPKVRLHAANIVRRFPATETTDQLIKRLPREDTPLVRAAMAAALGTAGRRDAAPLLMDMLGSARQIESITARQALVRLFGTDRGPTAKDWESLLR